VSEQMECSSSAQSVSGQWWANGQQQSGVRGTRQHGDCLRSRRLACPVLWVARYQHIRWSPLSTHCWLMLCNSGLQRVMQRPEPVQTNQHYWSQYSFSHGGSGWCPCCYSIVGQVETTMLCGKQGCGWSAVPEQHIGEFACRLHVLAPV
jgi:hypothetical protein